MDLTKRQAEVLQYVRSHQENFGIVPTVREICNHFGLKGPAGIHRILHVLVNKGYLTVSTGKKRSWRIPGGFTGKSIPLIGKITAGVPILAIENREEELPIDPSIFGSEDCFALHIQGDSMIDAYIKNGDFAVIRPQNHAENGEIVAVIVEDMEHEATLKILRKNQYATELLPANTAYAPLRFKGRQRSRIRIIGKYVGIIRRD
jgi:repressor LexA